MIELRWNNPISEEKLASYLHALDLPPGRRVLDVGCGCGEILIRVVRQFGATGVGIDTSVEHIAEAVRRAESRGCNSQIQFVVADARTFPIAPASFDLVICLGATHAFGLGPHAYPTAIQRMVAMIPAGGSLLIGEGYLKQPAPPEYRLLLGDSPPDSQTHSANVATGEQYGLTLTAAWTSSEEEWDEFEGTYQQLVEQHHHQRPTDPMLKLKLDRRRTWMDAYRRWGRETLGYGIYLFSKPARP